MEDQTEDERCAAIVQEPVPAQESSTSSSGAVNGSAADDQADPFRRPTRVPLVTTHEVVDEQEI
jgi:hypothetical protein